MPRAVKKQSPLTEPMLSSSLDPVANDAGEVQKLGKVHFDAITEVMVKSFYDYPVMQFMLNKDHPDYDQRIYALMRFYTDLHLINDWPAYGVFEADELVSVILINGPEVYASEAKLSALEAKLASMIGKRGMGRKMNYTENIHSIIPHMTHYYIDMLATLPRAQGKGHASKLIKLAEKLDMEDPKTKGLILFTEKERNVVYYQHIGFRLHDQIDHNGLTSWCLVKLTKDKPLTA